VRREKRMDRLIGKASDVTMGPGGMSQQDSAQINDTTQRLAFLQDKIDELKDLIDKGEKVKVQQSEHL
jgi:TolA-binding protein